MARPRLASPRSTVYSNCRESWKTGFITISAIRSDSGARLPYGGLSPRKPVLRVKVPLARQGLVWKHVCSWCSKSGPVSFGVALWKCNRTWKTKGIHWSVRAAMFNRCAVAHWRAVNNPQVCHGIWGRGFIYLLIYLIHIFFILWID